ncbi:MAG: peptidoglycan editing factor PgeF [Planctomycetota bacterium]|nr:peptidoglycan editing factor PgeF [Planctomycetota bacterium]
MHAPMLIESRLLADASIPPAFSARRGGVSTGTFDSLNFGNPGELEGPRRDPPASIAANFASVLEKLGVQRREVVQVHQVHGDQVHTVRPGLPSHPAPAGDTTKADALVTDDPTRVIAVRVADCTPVLLTSADGRIVSAVHAGWRGVVAGISLRALEAMEALGADRGGVLAAIGPCISIHHFEIGPEVIAQFRTAFGSDTPHVRETAGGKGHADMQGALAQQLRHAGVRSIDLVERCTVGEPESFFSHRRDQGLTGRMIGLIGPRDARAHP